MKIRYLLLLTVLVIAMSSLFSINSFAANIDDTDLVTLAPGTYKWADNISSCSDFSLSIPFGAVTTEYGPLILIKFYHQLNNIPVMEYRFADNFGYADIINIFYGSFLGSQYLNFNDAVDVPVELTKYLLPVYDTPDAGETPTTQTLTIINSNNPNEVFSFVMPKGETFGSFVGSEYDISGKFTCDVYAPTEYKAYVYYDGYKIIDAYTINHAVGTFYYNGEAAPEVPEPSEPEDPAPDEPPDKYREIFIVEEALYTREWIYQILNRPIDYVKYNITGNQIEFEFSYSDMTSSYIRTLLTSYIDLSFDGVYLVRGDTRFKIVEDKYYSISDNIDGLCLSYVENQSICSLYYEGRGFSEISFPIRDVAKIAIEKSYSDSYNNFDVYLQFNDGTTTFFEFSSVLPKVEGKTFAGFYIYDTENNVNVGDYIPCDGEFHDINQSGDFALNTCFLEYKSDFAVNFMNWSGTFTVRSFPFYTDLDYVIVTQDNKGITVEHYTPGADGELYVVDSEFFDDDTYVGIQKKPNRVNNFVEDDEFPLYIYISDKDVTYYLAPPDYEYLYDIHLGHEISKDNEELMDSISDALAELELPDTGDFSLQIDAIFDNSGYYRYMDIFKNILEFDLFTSLLVVSFVMAMAGYVLFGKRG